MIDQNQRKVSSVSVLETMQSKSKVDTFEILVLAVLVHHCLRADAPMEFTPTKKGTVPTVHAVEKHMQTGKKDRWCLCLQKGVLWCEAKQQASKSFQLILCAV